MTKRAADENNRWLDYQKDHERHRNTAHQEESDSSSEVVVKKPSYEQLAAENEKLRAEKKVYELEFKKTALEHETDAAWWVDQIHLRDKEIVELVNALIKVQNICHEIREPNCHTMDCLIQVCGQSLAKSVDPRVVENTGGGVGHIEIVGDFKK